MTTSFEVESHKHRGMVTYYQKHQQGGKGRVTLLATMGLVSGHFWFCTMMQAVVSWPRGGKRKSTKKAPQDAISSVSTSIGKPIVLVTGAKSDVGDFLLKQFSDTRYQYIAINRRHRPAASPSNIRWLQLEYFLKTPKDDFGNVDIWINLAPIWTSRPLGKLIKRFRPRRIIALSSTSVEGKKDSENKSEREVVRKLYEGEKWLIKFSESLGIELSILRPTLIYGGPRNKNVNFIKKIVSIFHVFPIVGEGKALRQPVHAEDVAIACKQVIEIPTRALRKIYNLAGAESLSYREMVVQIFNSLGTKPRIIKLPVALVKTAIKLLRWLPGCSFLSPDMATRMNHDLIYPIDKARDDFSYRPRRFDP